MGKFVSEGDTGGLVMGYNEGSNLAIWKYATEFVLADNFFQLFVSTLRSPPGEVQSPEILERLRAILFQ